MNDRQYEDVISHDGVNDAIAVCQQFSDIRILKLGNLAA